MPDFQAAVRRARKSLRLLVAFVVHPSVILFALLLGGGACAVTGINMLCGVPWALLTAAAILFTLAWLLLRGVSNA